MYFIAISCSSPWQLPTGRRRNWSSPHTFTFRCQNSWEAYSKGVLSSEKRSSTKSKGKRAAPQKKNVGAARKFSSSSSSSSYSGSSAVSFFLDSNFVLYPFWNYVSYKWLCKDYKSCLHLIFGFISHFSSAKLSSLPTFFCCMTYIGIYLFIFWRRASSQEDQEVLQQDSRSCKTPTQEEVHV